MVKCLSTYPPALLSCNLPYFGSIVSFAVTFCLVLVLLLMDTPMRLDLAVRIGN